MPYHSAITAEQREDHLLVCSPCSSPIPLPIEALYWLFFYHCLASHIEAFYQLILSICLFLSIEVSLLAVCVSLPASQLIILLDWATLNAGNDE